MREEATAVDIPPAHRACSTACARPANWLQLVRFGLVGGVGFVVNLAVYTLFVHGAGSRLPRRLGLAWLVAVLNNFVLNRHWTFDAREGRAHHQAMRFLLVSLVAEVVSLLLLTLLVEAGGPAKVPAQALAVAARCRSTSSATSSGASASAARDPPASRVGPTRRSAGSGAPVGVPIL